MFRYECASEAVFPREGGLGTSFKVCARSHSVTTESARSPGARIPALSMALTGHWRSRQMPGRHPPQRGGPASGGGLPRARDRGFNCLARSPVAAPFGLGVLEERPILRRLFGHTCEQAIEVADPDRRDFRAGYLGVPIRCERTTARFPSAALAPPGSGRPHAADTSLLDPRGRDRQIAVWPDDEEALPRTACRPGAFDAREGCINSDSPASRQVHPSRGG